MPSTKTNIMILLFVVITLFSIPVMAEVMDKEMSVSAVWLSAVVGGAIGFIVIHYRWWIGLITLLCFGFFSFGAVAEWYDPHAGPAIGNEAGDRYGIHAWVGLIVVFAAHIAGWISNFKRIERLNRLVKGGV